MSTDLGNAARDKLKSVITRVERLNDEKKNLTADIKEVFDEAKSFGLDAKIIRQCVRLRAMDAHDRAEQEAILDLYMDALSFETTPLGATVSVIDGGKSASA